MSRLMFVYLSGSEKGKTRIFTQNHVTIGTTDAVDLKLVPEEGGSFPSGVLADIYDDGGVFHLVPRGAIQELTLTINGNGPGGRESAAGYNLNDGDSIHVGHGLSSASVLFQILPENFSGPGLVARETKELESIPAQPVHPLTATLFVKELTASLWAEVPRRLKIFGVLLVSLILLGILGFFGASLIAQYRNGRRMDQLSEQLLAIQARHAEDQEQIRKQAQEIERLRDQGEQTRRFTQRIAELYSPGVCLIVGSYGFSERGTGRPLRYETADGANENPVDQNGNLLASVDGAGPPVQIDYTGTGFVVADGVIATNKHVVQPWATDQVAQIILQQGAGFAPRLETLVAFFPSVKSPFDLKVVSAALHYDAALCKFDQGNGATPIIPLSGDEAHSIIGEPVVLLGYPTGVDGLLQRIEENERREIQRQHGQSTLDVAAGLASRGLIRPLTTTGTITDALPSRIVHSAQTTEGGSGSPIFDRDGRVLAINSAILATTDGTQSFGGSNFGVPVRALIEMLQAYNKSQKAEATKQ